MIKIDKKNKWAINIGLHIPIPSISIELISDQEEELKVREPLSHNQEKEADYLADSQKGDSCQDAARKKETSSSAASQNAGTTNTPKAASTDQNAQAGDAGSGKERHV